MLIRACFIQTIYHALQWFGFFDGKQTLGLREQDIYKEDWIGLKNLDERGALHFLILPDAHVAPFSLIVKNLLYPIPLQMRISKSFISTELIEWLGV